LKPKCGHCVLQNMQMKFTIFICSMAGMSNWRPAGIFSVPYMIKNIKKLGLIYVINLTNLFTFEYFRNIFWLKMPLKQKQVQNFSKCSPQTTFLASKHLLRPAQCFEFDMPALWGRPWMTSRKFGKFFTPSPPSLRQNFFY